MKISDNKFIALTYELTTKNGENRELIEKTTTENPLEFIFGMNMMLQAFEQNIEGLAQGDSFKFSLSPEEAYGQYEEERLVELPKNIFAVDGKLDESMLKIGNALPMMDSEGNRLTGHVIDVKDDVVTMDFNHPLAGKTLHFEGLVEEVREATAEDYASLFSGGGCGGGGCSSCSGSDDGCGCGSGCGC